MEKCCYNPRGRWQPRIHFGTVDDMLQKTVLSPRRADLFQDHATERDGLRTFLETFKQSTVGYLIFEPLKHYHFMTICRRWSLNNSLALQMRIWSECEIKFSTYIPKYREGKFLRTKVSKDVRSLNVL